MPPSPMPYHHLSPIAVEDPIRTVVTYALLASFGLPIGAKIAGVDSDMKSPPRAAAQAMMATTSASATFTMLNTINGSDFDVRPVPRAAALLDGKDERRG